MCEPPLAIAVTRAGDWLAIAVAAGVQEGTWRLELAGLRDVVVYVDSGTYEVPQAGLHGISRVIGVPPVLWEGL